MSDWFVFDLILICLFMFFFCSHVLLRTIERTRWSSRRSGATPMCGTRSSKTPNISSASFKNRPHRFRLGSTTIHRTLRRRGPNPVGRNLPLQPNPLRVITIPAPPDQALPVWWNLRLTLLRIRPINPDLFPTDPADYIKLPAPGPEEVDTTSKQKQLLKYIFLSSLFSPSFHAIEFSTHPPDVAKRPWNSIFPLSFRLIPSLSLSSLPPPRVNLNILNFRTVCFI